MRNIAKTLQQLSCFSFISLFFVNHALCEDIKTTYVAITNEMRIFILSTNDFKYFIDGDYGNITIAYIIVANYSDKEVFKWNQNEWGIRIITKDGVAHKQVPLLYNDMLTLANFEVAPESIHTQSIAFLGDFNANDIYSVSLIQNYNIEEEPKTFEMKSLREEDTNTLLSKIGFGTVDDILKNLRQLNSQSESDIGNNPKDGLPCLQDLIGKTVWINNRPNALYCHPGCEMFFRREASIYSDMLPGQVPTNESLKAYKKAYDNIFKCGNHCYQNISNLEEVKIISCFYSLELFNIQYSSNKKSGNFQTYENPYNYFHLKNPVNLHPKWKKNVWNLIRSNTIAVGMSSEQVIMSWGDTYEKESQDTSSGNTEVWTYMNTVSGREYKVLSKNKTQKITSRNIMLTMKNDILKKIEY